MMSQYKTEWNDDFMDRKGIVNVNTAEEAAKLLQANVYATDPDYATKLMQIIKDAKRNPPLF
jgi:flagellum-specific peptidoglycan hydrolase FlgJ